MNGSRIAVGIHAVVRTRYADPVVMLKDLPPGEPINVSATLFLAYQKCPQQALARLHGIYGAPSRASFRGLLAHRIFARHLNDGAIAGEDFNQACREETGEHLNGVMTDLGLVPSEFRAVVAEVSDLYTRFKAFPTDGFDQAEAEFEVAIRDDVHLRGRIDAVFSDDEGSRIVDWKTGKELGTDATDQLAFYSWAWTEATGAPPAAAEALSIATGERQIEDFTPDDLATVDKRVAAMVTDLRSALDAGTDLDRTGGPHCTWCPLLESCDEGQTAIELLG